MYHVIYLCAVLTAVQTDRTMLGSHIGSLLDSFRWCFATTLGHWIIMPTKIVLRRRQHALQSKSGYINTATLIFHNCKKILYAFLNEYGHITVHNQSLTTDYTFSTGSPKKRGEMKWDREKKLRKNGLTRACRIHIATGVEINNKCDLLMKKERSSSKKRGDAIRYKHGHPKSTGNMSHQRTNK